jgi:2-polyprenyl-3-methyl-5-hydroxy-6-metoxy-1,4-benzoquinol methylase
MPDIPQDRVKIFINNSYWYHTIEFSNGLVSKGVYDHRAVLKYYGFPESFKNKTVLDVGAADGFFSFEFERRGAKSVMAIDTHKFDGSIGHTDISPAKLDNYIKKYSRHAQEKDRFSDICELLKINTPIKLLIAKAILNSSVIFKIESIYNLSSLNEKFDFVFCGDLFEHLKNPLEALENLVAVTNDMCVISLSSCLKTSKIVKIFERVGIGKLIKVDTFTTGLKYYGNQAGGSFFYFYPKTFREVALASGFKRVEIFSEFDLKNIKRNLYNHHAIFHCFV